MLLPIPALNHAANSAETCQPGPPRGEGQAEDPQGGGAPDRDPRGEGERRRGGERDGDDTEGDRQRGRPRQGRGPGDAAAIDRDAADEDAARLAVAARPRRRLHDDAAGPAAAQQIAAGHRDRQRLTPGRQRGLRDARAVDEHLDGVARARLDRLQLQRDRGRERRRRQIDAAEAAGPAAGQAAMGRGRPEAGQEGRVAGTAEDDASSAEQRGGDEQRGAHGRRRRQGRRDARLRAAPASRVLRSPAPARRRRGHRRTTSSPCSSWGRPSAPVSEQ